MSTRRLVPVLTAAGLMLTVGGCSGQSSSAPAPDKVKAAVQSLGGTPTTTYQETVVFRKPGEEHYEQQDVDLVPSKTGGAFQVVDAAGNIYRDYDDFLVNNALTR